jgi:putative ABC transport system permease protein
MELDLGYDRTNIAYVPLTEEAREKGGLIVEEALGYPSILETSIASGLPGRWNNERRVQPEGSLPGDTARMNVYSVGYDFTRLFGITIISGRDFSREFAEDANIILSESAARKLGWDSPLGRRLNIEGTTGTVVGVAEEFHLGETFMEKLPGILIHRKDAAGYAFFKWSGDTNPASVLEDLRSLWEKHHSDLPFVYGTMSELNERINRGFEKGYVVTLAIGLLTVVTSAFGLFGLATFTVQSRTKEIGIRKALGDSVRGIMARFLKVFLRLIVIANLIAWPLTYLMARKFILFMNPDFGGSVGTAAYLFTAAITFGVAVAAVAAQVSRAGRVNPAETLRYE